MSDKHLAAVRVGLACWAICWLVAAASPVAAQTIDQEKENLSLKRARLEQAQQQLREDIRLKTQMFYSVSQQQGIEDASFRRQESQLISLRSQEAEVQRLLIKTELRVIEATIKVEVCPDAAPDRRVVLAELKIAEAERRFLSDRVDAIHRSIDLVLDQFRSRTADLEARRAEIEQLQAKAQRITAELDKMAMTVPAARPTATVAAQ